MPFHSEPVIGHLTIHATEGLKLYTQVGSTSIRREIPTSYDNGKYQIVLNQDLGTCWLILK